MMEERGVVGPPANDGPIDGGWGEVHMMSAEERALVEYKRERLANVLNGLGGSVLPPGTEVVWDAHVSYAGEGPEPSFRRPGFRGQVVYEQDNDRPPEDRMVPSIRWIPVEGTLNAPA